MRVKKTARRTTQAELVTKLALLAATNRDAYRELRAVIWDFVVENSSRSDFPSVFS